jgi:hypothetical protein
VTRRTSTDDVDIPSSLDEENPNRGRDFDENNEGTNISRHRSKKRKERDIVEYSLNLDS